MRTLALVLFFLFPLAAHAQTEPAPGVGLSASVQDGQFDISVPVWSGPRLAFIPSVGLGFAQDVGLDLSAGVAARFYQRVAMVSPYFGIRAGVLLFSPSETESGPEQESTVDLLAGVLYGAEAFLTPKFSLGVEAQLNLTKSAEESLRFGNPGNVNVNTGAAVTATVYF